MQRYSYERPLVAEILDGFKREKRLLHIITGPRQVGKTTAALQIADRWNGPVIHASADLPLPPEPEWVWSHWDRAETEARRLQNENGEVLLILDEVQKVKGWSEVVKASWDKTCRDNLPIQVIILGSSSLLIQKGLTESLAGRFFLYRCPHWTFPEMKQAFSWDLEQWIFFGGYPGAAPFIDQEDIWSRYVMDSLVETVLAKDVLQLQTVSKPALLRHLFMVRQTYRKRCWGAPVESPRRYSLLLGLLETQESGSRFRREDAKTAVGRRGEVRQTQKAKRHFRVSPQVSGSPDNDRRIGEYVPRNIFQE